VAPAVFEAGDALSRLLTAVNEGNSALRSILLKDVWADDARLILDEECIADGREAVAELIEAARKDPRFHVRLTDAVRKDDGLEWSRWEVRQLQRARLTHNVVARVSNGVIGELTVTTADPADGGGKLRERLENAVLSNPVAAAGVLGGALYLALRVPVGLFYGDLGVTPDEVGFGPEVLVPQSLTLLMLFLLVVIGIGLAGSVAVPVARVFTIATRLERLGERRRAWALTGVIVVIVVLGLIVGSAVASLVEESWSGTATRSIQIGLWVLISVLGARVLLSLRWVRPHVAELVNQERRQDSFWYTVRVWSILLASYLALFLIVALPIWAVVNADQVRGGGAAGGRLVPWRAVPASLHWTASSHVRLTNNCRVLRLLGMGNGQLVLFDTKLDKVFRVPVDDADATVQRRCASRLPRTPPAPARSRGRRR
jgi:hypothetical protein